MAPNGTNLALFKIADPNCTKIDLNMSQICPIWGTIWPNWDAKFDFPAFEDEVWS